MQVLRGQLSRRSLLGAAALGTVALPLAACTVGNDSDKKAAESSKAAAIAKANAAVVSFTPPPSAPAPSPIAKIAVSVVNATLNPDVKLTNPEGVVVTLTFAPDRMSATVAEPLGYGVKYVWSGSALGKDGTTVPVARFVTTLNPDSQTSVVINIADGQTVGIAVPLILQFDAPITDKAAVEKALVVTTNPPTEGAWAWLPDDNGSRVHWRSKEYFIPGTTVAMKGSLYGLDYGGGAYGETDVTSNFYIGRSQIVRASAPSHRIQVMRGTEVYQDFPCSYGEADLPRNITRTGIHVVSEKHQDFYMSNPAAGYFNVHERWAVRISNNGEFIHANPETIGDQGSINVTNGCINLSLDSAEAYYNGALYGDPVEVTGTSIELSSADGDIYDWTIDWPTWQSMSAL